MRRWALSVRTGRILSFWRGPFWRLRGTLDFPPALRDGAPPEGDSAAVASPEALGCSQRIGETRSRGGLDLRNNAATIVIQNVGGDVPRRHPIVPFAKCPGLF